MDNALSGGEIKEHFNGKCKIMTYGELSQYNDIDKLLHPYGRVCILYVWKKDPNPYGHWVCCFRNKKGNIEVFDSFGTFIDDTLNTIDKRFRIQNNEYYKTLSKMLVDSNYDVEYNDKKLQNDKSLTCGKWCVYRMKRNDLDIDEFNDLFSSNTLENDKDIINIFS